MGDRGNIKVGGVYLYTHWGGSVLKQTLQSALKRHLRWDDEPYLTRIIFCTMIDGDEDGETGFGISDRLTDNEHPIIEVDVKNQKVKQWSYGDEKKEKVWSFEKFVEEEFEEE